MCNGNGVYTKTPTKKERKKEQLFDRMKERIQSFLSDGTKAKELLKQECLKRAKERNTFLPDERTAMITEDETDLVIRRSFQYIIALTEINLIVLRFQVHHYLYQGFKESLNTFTREVLVDDWGALVMPDGEVKAQIQELEGKIAGITDSLLEVQRIQAKF
mmetsp:Transcript_58809/g.70137  ORF Transcript_58809/g.70137 Transcript_58809/m.70137 type:complete len:161 (-) Transcript_58809:68-550(-)